MIRLTVLVCTHDRVGLLQRALNYLDRAHRPRECRVEVLVIANACTDRTHEFLQNRALADDGLPLRWEAEPTPGKSHALNRAMGEIDADWVAFVDDDHRVDPSYLDAIATAIRSYPDADALCGRILPDWNGTEPAWVHDESDYRIYPLPVPRYDLGDAPLELSRSAALPGGGNLAVRTSLFSRVGKFATDYGPVGDNLGGAEDREWIERAIGVGARLHYVPGIIQYHYADPARLTLRYVVRKAYERSASVVRLSAATAGDSSVPGYMLAKVARHLFSALGSLQQRKRRFYMVRLAASAGEVKGRLQARSDLKRRARPVNGSAA